MSKFVFQCWILFQFSGLNIIVPRKFWCTSGCHAKTFTPYLFFFVVDESPVSVHGIPFYPFKTRLVKHNVMTTYKRILNEVWTLKQRLVVPDVYITYILARLFGALWYKLPIPPAAKHSTRINIIINNNVAKRNVVKFLSIFIGVFFNQTEIFSTATVSLCSSAGLRESTSNLLLYNSNCPISRLGVYCITVLHKLHFFVFCQLSSNSIPHKCIAIRAV